MRSRPQPRKTRPYVGVLPLSPLELTLTRNTPFCPDFRWNCANFRQITSLESSANLLSPLELTLTKNAPVSPLESTLTKKGYLQVPSNHTLTEKGEGGAVPPIRAVSLRGTGILPVFLRPQFAPPAGPKSDCPPGRRRHRLSSLSLRITGQGSRATSLPWVRSGPILRAHHEPRLSRSQRHHAR